MSAARKCLSVNFDRRFDLILLRAENEAWQTQVDENRQQAQDSSSE